MVARRYALNPILLSSLGDVLLTTRKLRLAAQALETLFFLQGFV
jgi:hypothetical protein